MLATGWSSAAEARDRARQRIDIDARQLPEAISELSRQARVSIGTEGDLPELRTPPLHGDFSIDGALSRLLAGSGYTARKVGGRAWRIVREKTRPKASAVALPPAGTGGEIVVTAAKQDRNLADLPMAVTIVSLEGTRRPDPTSGTQEIARQMDGLSLTGLGPGRNRMVLRGISDSAFSGQNQSTVAIILDDSRLTYSAPDPDIRLVDVEKVEVLKGPQGSLYGTGALGGVYHIVTRSAQIDETSLNVQAGAESVAGGSTGYSISAAANIPLIDEHAALRLVGFRDKEPGWVDTGDRRNSNSTLVSAARARLGVEVGPWRADLTGFVQLLNSRDSQYVYAPHARSRPAQIAEPHDNDLSHISGRVARKWGETDLTVSSALTWQETSDRLDATIGAEEFPLRNPRTLDSKHHYRVWDSEARISGRLGSIHWLAGVTHVEARQNDMIVLRAPKAALVADSDRHVSVDSAVFGNLSLLLTGSLSIDAGARVFRSVVSHNRTTTNDAADLEFHKSGVTPSAALSFRPRLGRLLFLRYGSAFRQGAVEIDTDGKLDVLRSDELATMEAGWREQLPGGGSLDLGVHWSRWEHIQSETVEDNGLIDPENAGNALIIGAEASLDLPLRTGWRLRAGATYEDARLTTSTLRERLATSRLPVVPRYTLRAALTHDFSLGKADFILTGGMRYVGSSQLSFDPDFNHVMGKFLETTFDATLRWHRFVVALSLENVLGRKDDTFSFGNSLRLEAMPQYIPQAPRRVSLSLARHF